MVELPALKDSPNVVKELSLVWIPAPIMLIVVPVILPVSPVNRVGPGSAK